MKIDKELLLTASSKELQLPDGHFVPDKHARISPEQRASSIIIIFLLNKVFFCLFVFLLFKLLLNTPQRYNTNIT